jgi:glycosyltransferase involved in cell wall biosynthesis
MGYGNPQLSAIVRSLRARYQIDDAIIVEPDEPDRKARPDQFADLRIVRIHSLEHPHSTAGRVEYIAQASGFVDRLRPDVLVLSTTYTLPVIFRLSQRPTLVIYYQLEPVEPYGRFDLEMNGRIADAIDVVIYPEENRAALDIRLFGDRSKPFVVMYNCAPYEGPQALAAADRNGRIVYHGTVEEGRTFAEFFTDDRMGGTPLDIFGRITGPAADNTRRKLVRLDGHVRYLGNLDARALAEQRVAYSFSLVAWNPIDASHWAACPNKFFESIAAGVPPIAAPHPQCRMLIERYRCGLVMDSWDLSSFLGAIERALMLYPTKVYSEMVENCRVAAERELNWDAQFAKLIPHVDSILGTPVR